MVSIAVLAGIAGTASATSPCLELAADLHDASWSCTSTPAIPRDFMSHPLDWNGTPHVVVDDGNELELFEIGGTGTITASGRSYAVTEAGQPSCLDWPPTASISVTPDVVAIGQPVTFESSAGVEHGGSRELDFRWDPVEPQIGQGVDFRVEGVAGIDEVRWNFGGAGCSPFTQTTTCTPGLFSDCTLEQYQYASAGAKTVTLTVIANGQTFGPVINNLNVLDEGSCSGGCTYSIAPTSASYPAGGDTGTFDITTQSDCAWSASSNRSWARITFPDPPSGNGSSTVQYVVDPNTGLQRSGAITVSYTGGSSTHTFAQEAGGGDDEPDEWLWTVLLNDVPHVTSRAPGFVHTFSVPGIYKVTLEVSNCAGSDIASTTLVVQPAPQLSWDSSPTHGLHTRPRDAIAFGDVILVGLDGAAVGGGLFARDPIGVWAPVTTSGFGDPENTAISAFAQFDGFVYAGTTNGATGAQLWRSSDGAGWAPVMMNGFGDPLNDEISSLVTHAGDLYAAVRSVAGIEVWRTANGVDWSQVNVDGFGSSVNQAPGAMASFGGSIYASVANLWNAEVWRRVSGTTWEQVNTDGFGNNANESAPAMVVFDSHLYVGTANDNSGSEVWRSQDGTTWSQSSAGGFGNPFDNEVTSGLVAHDGTLFAGTYNFATGAEIWATTDGSAWHPWALGGFGDQYNWSARAAAVFGDDLFIATENPNGFQVWQLALPVPGLFSDGFESGGTSTWSAVVGD